MIGVSSSMGIQAIHGQPDYKNIFYNVADNKKGTYGLPRTPFHQSTSKFYVHNLLYTIKNITFTYSIMLLYVLFYISYFIITYCKSLYIPTVKKLPILELTIETYGDGKNN